MLTFVEENYLKGILHISTQQLRNEESEGVGTNSLAEYLKIKPSSVNEMLKRLNQKKMVNYKKYKKITLTEGGKFQALRIVRKHRLWETFLYTKLGFEWDEVHDVAEQLEHIKSTKLIEKIDAFLKFPKFDPHGDPIPDIDGNFPVRTTTPLNKVKPNKSKTVLAVSDSSKKFLSHLENLNIKIGSSIKVLDTYDYDKSVQITTDHATIIISEKVAKHILVG